MYEVGEILQIEPAMFEDSGDANIDLILKLVYEINSVKDSIRNIGAIEQ